MSNPKPTPNAGNIKVTEFELQTPIHLIGEVAIVSTDYDFIYDAPLTC